MASHEEEVKRIRIIPDIHTLAAGGFDKIPKDDIARLKWVGFYKQKQAPFFMVLPRAPRPRPTPRQADWKRAARG